MTLGNWIAPPNLPPRETVQRDGWRAAAQISRLRLRSPLRCGRQEEARRDRVTHTSYGEN